MYIFETAILGSLFYLSQMLIFYLPIFIGILYVIHIGIYTYGFNKVKPFQNNQNNLQLENKTYISLIIPFKNEEEHLPKLLNGIKQQTLNFKYFKLVFIDDHSTDSSVQKIQEHISNYPNWQLLTQDINKNGKKIALLKGISESDSELIVTSDADCVHQPNWLQEILYFYLEHKPKMIIAPVLMTGNSFFQKNQSLEFLSLTSSTAGAAGINRPTMCNGANLAYKKDTFNEFKDALYSNEDSGDDLFLMHNIKKKYLKDIRYLKSEQAVVYTEAEKKIGHFIKQRLRWVSKSKSYFDFDTIFSSILVLFMNLLIGSLAIASIFNNSFFIYLIFAFSIKLLADFSLLFLTAKYFKQKQLLFFFPLLSLLYPFYIIIIAFLGLFIKKVKWKD